MNNYIEPKIEIVKPLNFKIDYGYQVLNPESCVIIKFDMAKGFKEPIPDPPTRNSIHLMPDSFKDHLREYMATKVIKFITNSMLVVANKEWKLMQLLEKDL